MGRASVAMWALVMSAVSLVGVTSCERYQEPLPRRDRLNFPIGMAIHPSGDYLYVVNSNFDSRYSPAYGGTVAVVDLHTNMLLPQSTPFIPSFGGYIKLNEDASKAYVTARSGDSLVALDVSSTAEGGFGAALTCPDAEGVASSDPTRCVLHRVPDTSGSPELSSDPFGLEVVTVTRQNGQGEPQRVDVVAVSHLLGDTVTAVSIPNGDLSAASLVSAPLLAGGNQIARRPGTMEMYVAGRSTNQVSAFLPYISSSGEAEAIFARRSVVLNTAATSVDARGIAFGEQGEKLYVSTRNPDRLYVFDVIPSNLEDGSGLTHQLVHSIPLSDQPADILVHHAADGREILFIPCYDAKRVEVVDPELGVVIATIELDENPYAIVSEQGTAAWCQAPGERCRAYVSLFADASELSNSCDASGEGCGSVAVIDLDPLSDRYLQVIAKIR